MATLLLAAAVSSSGAAGAALFGGQLVAGALGAFLDQRFVWPTLFPQDPVEGPKLGDLSISSAEEGAGWVWAAGPTVRIPGLLIWADNWREYKDDTQGGGKGGSGGEFVQYKYSAHLAVGMCEADSAISRVLEILADTKVIFDVSPDITVGPSTAIAATAKTAQTANGAGGWWTFYYLRITAGLSGPDLSVFKTGHVMTVSGFAAPQNNGDFPVVSAGDDFDSNGNAIGTFVKVELPAAGANASAGASVTLFEKNPQYSKKQMAAPPVFQLGGTTNQPDDLIEAVVGSATPAFADRAWFRLKALQGFDFGNRPPNFEVVAEIQPEITVGETIEQLCARAGLASNEVDASSVTAQLRGFHTVGQVSGVTAVQPLLVAYDVVAREPGTKLEFYPRSQVPAVAIAFEDLAVRAEGEQGVDRPFRVITPTSAFDPPSTVVVRYRDAEKRYQRGSTRDRGRPLLKEVQLVVDLNVVLTSSEARQIASRMRYLARSRDRVRFRIPPKYVASVRPGTRCTWTDSNGESWSVLVDRVDRGANWILECEGRVEDPRMLTGLAFSDPPEEDGGAAASTGTQNPQFTPGYVRLELLDLPALRDEEVESPGFYAAACYPDDRLTFTGAVLYESQDDGLSWQPVATFTKSCWMGNATSSLAAPVSTAVLDWAHTLTVEMDVGELSTVTEDECVRGANRAAIGYEVIGFVEAELVAPKTYELRGLLRGLRGTEDELEHVAGDPFIMLSNTFGDPRISGLQFVGKPTSAIGTTRLYRVVASGGLLEEAPSRAFTISGRTLQPFAPVHVVGTRDGSNNLTIIWTRRTRALYRTFSPYSPPLVERDELYDVEILDGPDVVRTFSNVASTSQAYTAAQQTTDGLTPGDPVNVRIYQRGEFIGRGIAATATV